MPKAKPEVSHGGKRPGEAHEHLSCGESDASWETALIMARSCLRDTIWELCKDPARRAQSHTQIYTTVEKYVRSLTRVEKRKSGKQITFRREFLEQPLAGVEALERLESPQATYTFAKAWTELPMVAQDALNHACLELREQPLRTVMTQWPTVPGTFIQLNIAELAQLLPVAISRARSYGNRNPIRDDAVLTILREYMSLLDKSPLAKEASRFIASIENCYRELLPSYGFAIGSDATIYRLLKRARADF